MPLAGVFCRSADEAAAAPRFPLTWLRCQGCGLVQVREDVSDANLFEQYNYASSTVPGLVRHFESYADFLKGHFGAGAGVRFLEIGCNDGVLLRRLPDAWKRAGVDPSDVARSGVGEADGYDLAAEPFSAELVRSRNWEGSWDGISGSNCLAHISDLGDIFAGVHLALREGGWFWVEVHDLEALLEGAQWDTIYHEHKVEWSVDALQRCVERVGFELKVVERLPLHGGLLRCGFEKRTEGSGRSSLTDCKPHPKLTALAEAYRRRAEVPAVERLLQAQSTGHRIVAYGASGRANVYLNQMRELNFDYIVDEAPLRTGTFLPSVGTPVRTRAEFVASPGAHCLVTAWNYRDDIVAKNPEFSGEWLTAFPVS